MNFQRMLKLPGAFLPLTMSCAALAVVLVHLRVSGMGHEADEGAAAHAFQLLILAQIPLMALFACRRGPTAPKNTVAVIALQACAALIAILPVWWFGL